MLADKLRSATAAEKLYVDDVFSTWLYDGNGSTQTITNGIDLAGKGGLVWIKERNTTSSHSLFDTTRGTLVTIGTNNTDANFTLTGSVTAFNSNGFSVGSASRINSTGIYASWTFRNAPKFFTHTTVSHTNGVATNISLSELGEVGMVVAKITNTTGDWITWHRSLTAGNNLRLNTTAAQTTTNAWLSVSGTAATLASAAPTGTYVIYAWAHDASAEGFVQCGTFTGDGLTDLGWEPQFFLYKRTDSTGNWGIQDTLRGFTASGANTATLFPNTTGAETSITGAFILDAQGVNRSGATGTFVYLAIRMPNKPPTSGTQVFQPTVYTGTNVDNRLVNTGIKTDMVWLRARSLSGTGYEGFVVGDRLRGQPWLKTGATAAELSDADSLDQQLVSAVEYGTAFSSMTGVWVGNDATAKVNSDATANNHIALAFQRRPGFFDIVCYTGDNNLGRTVSHSLGVKPQLILVKQRGSSTSDWIVYAEPLTATKYIRLNLNQAELTSSFKWNDTEPTASVFTVGSVGQGVNTLDQTYVAYLFASLPGISKVGSYTGNGGTSGTNGTSQTINCGFTTGARFVLVKQSSGTGGDWYVYDTARGIVAGNDPYLLTNGTQAEITTTDIIEPDNTGFVVNQTSGADMNVTGATYIYLAIA